MADTAALDAEVAKWRRSLNGTGPEGWLFPSERQAQPIRPGNYLKRVLKPLAVEAGVGVTDTGKREEDGTPILTSDITYQALRRTCATYFRQDLKALGTVTDGRPGDGQAAEVDLGDHGRHVEALDANSPKEERK